MAEIPLKSIKFPDLPDTYTVPQIDNTLTQQGMAADAKATGDAIRAISGGSGLTSDIKEALLACFEQVAWIGNDGQDYYDALEAALYPPVNLVSISAVYTQSGIVYTTDTLDSLKSDLVVTAHYEDQTSAVVSDYTLSGTLTAGTSIITVSYGGKTTTFNVTVTANNTLYLSASTSDAQYKDDTSITGLVVNASGAINIAGQSFAGCTNLAFARFETPVKIYSYAFSRCSSLTAVTFYQLGTGDNTTTLVASAFSNCANLADIYVPWSEGAVANAPWGAPNTATIHYNYTPPSA